MMENELIDILSDPEFNLYWDKKAGKEFRKAVVDLICDHELLKMKYDFLKERTSWIPCDRENMPRERTEVFIQDDEGRTWIGSYSEGTWHTDTRCFDESKIVAWMVLPGDYKK